MDGTDKKPSVSVPTPNNAKRTAGRRPTAVPPPVIEAGTVSGGIDLRPEDLTQIAGETGLEISVDSCQLDLVATRIASILGDYIVGCRFRQNKPKTAEIEKWTTDVGRWASEGLVLLQQTAGRLRRCFARGVAMTRKARRHPVSSYLRFAVAGAEYRQSRRGQHHLSAVNHLFAGWWETDEKKLFAMLHGAGLTSPGPPGHDSNQSPYQLTDGLVRRMPFGLEALKLLAAGATRKAQATSRRRRPDHERRYLFLQLAVEFEKLHQPNLFGVGNKFNAANTRHQPYGPVIEWCRALFSKAVKRVQNATTDPLPELQDLVQWAERSDALAERIDEARKALEKIRHAAEEVG